MAHRLILDWGITHHPTPLMGRDMVDMEVMDRRMVHLMAGWEAFMAGWADMGWGCLA